MARSPDRIVELQERFLEHLIGAERIHITSSDAGRAIDFDYIPEDIVQVNGELGLYLRRVRKRSYTSSGVSSLVLRASELVAGYFQVIPLMEKKPGQFKPMRGWIDTS